MNRNLTVREYIQYLAIIHHNNSQGEKLLAGPLPNITEIPEGVLNSPLLATIAQTDSETIKAISEIKAVLDRNARSKPKLKSFAFQFQSLWYGLFSYVQKNFVQVSFAVGAFILLIISSSLLSPIQVIDSGNILAGAAGVESIPTETVEGSYITNLGSLVLFLGGIVIAFLLVVMRKK